jgi:hypothetical protein
MAGELFFPGDIGATYYAHVIRPTDGHVWNAETLGFQSVASGNWTAYDLALAANPGTGFHTGDFPTGITTAGRYGVVVYQQAGEDPAPTDVVAGAGELEWTGSAVLSLGATLARLLGLSHENWGIRDTVFEGASMTAANLFVYDSAANALANDGVTGVVAAYAFAATHTGASLDAASQRRTV